MNHVQQFLRCYTEPIDRAKPATKKPRQYTPTRSRPSSPEAQAIKDSGKPYDGWCLVIDTETTTDVRQDLRLGVYEIHGIGSDAKIRRYRAGTLTRAALDTRRERGIFYNPTLPACEIALLTKYARRHGMGILPVDMFIKDVFYQWVYTYQALCIGHNLAFDLSRLATQWTSLDRGDYAGGFALTLCNCGYADCLRHPPLRIKHIGPAKNMYNFRTVGLPHPDGTFRPSKTYRGRFLDTMTLGRALLGPGSLSLRGLGERAGAAMLKDTDHDEHGGLLTMEYIDYATRDVEATWALYQALCERYKQHGTSRDLWAIYSEASLGKAYFKDIGVPRFLAQHKDFPREVIGHAMEGYYGGRSEVRQRLEPVEVIHCDFKSEYPTVNALMHLQSLWRAKRLTVRACADDLRSWLPTLTLADLQQPATWQRMRVLVKVRPHKDMLPVRSTFGDGFASTNIALTYLTGLDTWYTLPDVIASYVLTGKVPEIIDAVEVVPSKATVKTKAWALFGDERYTIDLNTQDFFTAVIDLRTRVQADLTVTPRDTPEWEQLDSLQRALKLLANSTSYGVWVEVNQEHRTNDAKKVMCYDQDTHEAFTHVVEKPGTYFGGCIGTFIPAGGRLLLAIAERLATDRGLGYAFCDTDSMSFTRPDGMSRADFRQRVHEITAWFTPLSPYESAEGEGKPPLLQQEDYNDWDGKPEPLYCLAISAKRYVLYNRLPDGTYRIRKFSSHGVGTWQRLKEYVPRADSPTPHTDTYKLGGARWMYDLWHHAIEQAEYIAAHPDVEDWQRCLTLGDALWLDVPATQQVTMNTAHLYQQFAQHFAELRPFNFVVMLPALLPSDLFWRVMDEQNKYLNGHPEKYDGLAGIPFYESPDGIRRKDTHALVEIEHKTLRECLRDYYQHPEAKAANPDGIGVLDRPCLFSVEHIYIGKETNEVWEETEDESEGTLGHEDAQQFSRYGVRQAIMAHGVAVVAEASAKIAAEKDGYAPVPIATLKDIANGRTVRADKGTVRKILAALSLCEPAHDCCTDGATPTAAELYERKRQERRERRGR